MATPLLEQDKQSRLKLLIAKGKEQGYLTYSEVNAVSYTHLTLPTTSALCRSRWSPDH